MYTVERSIFKELISVLIDWGLVTDITEDDNKIVLRVMTKEDSTKYEYFFSIPKKVNQHLIPLRIENEGGTIFDGFLPSEEAELFAQKILSWLGII